MNAQLKPVTENAHTNAYKNIHGVVISKKYCTCPYLIGVETSPVCAKKGCGGQRKVTRFKG